MIAQKMHAMIIRNALVLPSANEPAQHLDILVENGLISAIGPRGMAAPDGIENFDASDLLIHPGLINAHTHGHGAYAKAMGGNWTLELLLNAGPWISGGRELEDHYLSATLNAAEMALKGTTSCYDLFSLLPHVSIEGVEAVCAAYDEVGVRALVAPMVADRSIYDALPGLITSLPAGLRINVEAMRPKNWKETFAVLQPIYSQNRGRSLSRVALAPTIPMLCSDDFLISCQKLAEEFSIPLHSHIAESKVQAVIGMQEYGKTIVQHLDSIGLLTPELTMAHAIWLTEGDMVLAARRGVGIAHNPASNMRLGSGLADVRGMLHAGVNVSLGADGSNSSDNQNMYEAMRLSSFVSKVRTPNYEKWLSTKEAFFAATEGGAKALGLAGKAGKIAVGYYADLVFLDLNHINWIPVNDVVNQLVHVEDGSSVLHVMVNGRWIVRERDFENIELTKIAEKVRIARARIKEMTEEKRKLVEELAPYVGHIGCSLSTNHHYSVERYGSII